MFKFFICADDIYEEKIYLKDDNFNHGKNVLRLNVRRANTSSCKRKWEII